MQFINPLAPILMVGGNSGGPLPLHMLSLFAELAGGKEARLAVITSGSRIPLEIGPRYVEYFDSIGVQAQAYPLLTRAESNSPDHLAGLDSATGIFFSGGEQLLTTTRLGGTLALEIIRARHAAGAVLGGTSAGASVMSSTMIAFGEEGERPHHGSLALAPGLGFLQGIVVDQHFSQRDRIGRLTTAVLYNPEHLGVGIDENTAVLVRSPATMEVYGPATVTVLDGLPLEETDVADVEPLDVTLHQRGLRTLILTAGQVFDLDTRMVKS